MGDLTKNISRHELACNCGCGFDTGDIETVLAVQDACDHFAKVLGIEKVTLDINSGARCFVWNEHEKGSKYSKHLDGRAIDHRIREVSVKELHEYYMVKYPGKYGIGKYRTFVHLDTRKDMARW